MKRLSCLLAALALYLPVLPSMAYERLQGPTELLYSDPDLACPGYTLFGARGTTYLLDLDGQVVQTWPVGTSPHLLADGHILDASRDDPSGTPGPVEVDWDGNVVWEYTEQRPGYAPHHDWVRIHNRQLNAPTTLYLANKSITNEQALAAGADPRNAPDRDAQVDAVVEVDMTGKVVWEWWFFDHVIQDVDATKPNYVGAGKTVADYPGRLNLNLPGKPLRRDWLHCNSIDYNPELDQIVVNSVQGELYVIHHGGTFVAGDPAAGIAKAAGPAGDFLCRFGDPARYGQGAPPSIGANWDSASSGHKQMGGAHDVTWIPAGLPGAGHLLIFNYEQYLYQRTPHSEVLEVNPFLDGNGQDTGHYLNPPDALWVQHHCGVFRSTDRGGQWQMIDNVPPSCFGFAGAVHPSEPDTAWLVPAESDEIRLPVAGQVNVARTRDGGRSWDSLTDHLPQDNAHDLVYRHGLAIDPIGDRLVMGSTTGNLWVTEDQGDHWTQLSGHLPPIYCVRFEGT